MSYSETVTKEDLKNVLNEVLPIYSSTGFIVKYYTATSATSVSANGGTAWFQVRVDSADDPVAIVGYYLNGGSGCSVYNLALQTDSNGRYASFAVRNGASTTSSITATVYVLCKQELTHFTQAMADYIVEQGTSGIWTYRKWNSGIAECWGESIVGSNTYTANGGYKNVVEALPSGLFNATPPTVLASGRIDSVIRTMIGYTSADSATQVQTYLVNMYSSTVTKTGKVSWHVIGTWK